MTEEQLENKCYDCKHCFDNEDHTHFKRCEILGICVDCQEYACEGKNYILKNKK